MLHFEERLSLLSVFALSESSRIHLCKFYKLAITGYLVCLLRELPFFCFNEWVRGIGLYDSTRVDDRLLLYVLSKGILQAWNENQCRKKSGKAL